MTKKTTQQEVRQRAGFRCEECSKPTTGHYAHIIPHTWGGPYDFENLLFLCPECHPKFDVSVFRRGSKEANSAIEAMKKIKDKGQKDREELENTLLFFTNHDQTIVKIGDGITIKSSTSIFRTNDGVNLLSVNFQDGRIILNGIFYDETDNVLLEIRQNKFRAHGEMLWDLAIKNGGELTLESKDHKIIIKLVYNDPILNLTGKFFLDGAYIEASSEGISFNGNPSSMRNNTLIGDGLIFNREGGMSF